MKLSEQWLREWVNPKLTQAELTSQLSMAGLEVDSVFAVAADCCKVVVGNVLSCESHPNADKLSICLVDVAEVEPLTIVCGAKNVRKGLKVAVAKVGAILGDNFKIKASKLRGVLSHGMLCSSSELGLTEQSSGIMELADEAPIGEDIRQYLQLDDSSIDIDLTPNRSDCLSVKGIAREVALLNRLDFSQPFISKEIKSVSTKTMPITIQASAACPRYMGRVIENINMGARTPLYIQERLRRSGLRSIDAVVDICNYVMLELGQPLHAFDLAKITDTIQVRFAYNQETFTALGEKELSLSKETLVIADDQKVLAMAGVMGGANSGVSQITKDIFIESAFFAPDAILGKARRYGLHSDAAFRYERGVDPDLAQQALMRVSQLLLDIVGGEAGPIICKESSDQLPQQKKIKLDYNEIENVLGLQIAHAEVDEILLHLGLVKDGSYWLVPSHRFDLNIAADLIEEIARVYGYDNIPAKPIAHEIALNIMGSQQLSAQRLRHFLQDSAYHEIISYSFINKKTQKLVDPDIEALALKNPLSPDMAVMRSSLFPGLLNALRYNINRQQDRLRLFEIGLRFYPGTNGLKQEQMLAGLLYGNALPEQWGIAARKVDFFDLKGELEALFSLSMQSFDVMESQHAVFHPAQQANIIVAGKSIGRMGVLHPKLAKSLSLPENVLLFECLLATLLQTEKTVFSKISKYPSTRRDIALLLDKTITAANICTAVKKIAGPLLKDIQIFDLYEGVNIEDGKKSMAFSLILQDSSRTLIDSEVNALVTNILCHLQEKFQAILRE